MRLVKTKQEKFLNWFESRSPSRAFSDYSSAISSIDRFARRKHICTGTFLEISDLEITAKLLKQITDDKVFSFLHKKQMKLITHLLQEFCEFLKERSIIPAVSDGEEDIGKAALRSPEDVPSVKQTLPVDAEAIVQPMGLTPQDEAAAAPLEKAPVPDIPEIWTGLTEDKNDKLLAFLKTMDIPFSDKRAKNGCLWIKGDKSLERIVLWLCDQGYPFVYCYRENEKNGWDQAWYLDDRADGKNKAAANPGQLRMEAVQKEQVIPQAGELEPSLAQLLADEDMQELREALAKQGVLSLAAFKKLNFWAFLARTAIYDPQKRTDIYRRVITRINKGALPERADQRDNAPFPSVYYGNSSAEAFLHFCEELAHKHPQEVRALLDAKYNGQGSVVLSSADRRGNGLKLSDPVAFIDPELTMQAAIVYGEWLSKACGEKAPRFQIIDSNRSAYPRVVSSTGTKQHGKTPNEGTKASSEQARSVVESPEKTAQGSEGSTLERFSAFLQCEKGLSVSTSRGYCTALRQIEAYIRKRDLQLQIMEADPSSIQRSINVLTTDEEFAALNKRMHHQYSAALGQFVAFLTQDKKRSKKQRPEQKEARPDRSPLIESSISAEADTNTPSAKSGTIVDAVIIVLEQAAKPLSVREITEEIIRNDLYTFNTKTPVVVVSGAIKAVLDSSGEKTRAKRERIRLVLDAGGKRQFFLAEQEQRFFGKKDLSSSVVQAVPQAMATRCNTILAEDFVDGLRLNGMRIRKFRNIYEERYHETLEQDDEALIALLKQVCEFRDERLFARQKTGKTSLLDTICQDVFQVLKGGASCAYPQQIFEKYKTPLAEQLSIYTNEAFQPLLLHAADGQLVLVSGLYCLPKKTPNLAEDIRRLFQKCYEPLNYEQLKERLWYVPFSRVKSALNADPAIVNIGQETYFYAPNYPISTQELSALRSAVQERIEEEGYIVARDLRELMQAYCPNALMDTAAWKDWGIRDVMAWLLRDSFDFTGIVISAKGAALDTQQVFRSYCKNHLRVTLEELKGLCAKLDIPFIYWNAVTEEMVRISQTDFVSKKSISFDIDATDKALDAMCSGDYMPLKDVTLFMALPAVEFPWNGYLLESYLRGYSKMFHLEQFAANESTFVGAMVRRTSKIRTMQELIVDALAHEGTWTNEKEALSFIVQAGYRTQRTMAKSTEIVKQAKTLREQLNAGTY